MAIGPVQLLALGFNEPQFRGEILNELARLRESDTVRVIDSLTVYKDAQGEVSTLEVSQMDRADREELGTVVGALIGFGAGGLAGAEAGAEAGARAMADNGDMFDAGDALDVIEEIPPNSAAAVILLEHRWAIPLRDAIYRANGFPIASTFVTPLDLVAVGLLQAEEAEREQSLLARADAAKAGSDDRERVNGEQAEAASVSADAGGGEGS